MIVIRVINHQDRFIKKCLQYKINLYRIKYEKDSMTVRIYEEDLERIVKLNYYSKIEVIRYLGIKGALLHLKQYFFDYLLLCIALFLLFLISNCIVEVEVKHENKELIKRVNAILKEKKITRFTIGKSLGDLNTLSDEILYENRDFLDWISINKVGMKYIVSFEERIIFKKEEKAPYCHVVASKNGVIHSIKAIHGVEVKEKSEYVKKGDIIISGEIILNEEVQDNVCAEGEVLAETWYKIHVTVPLNYEEREKTKNKRYNLIMNGNRLRKKKYEVLEDEKICKIGPLSLVREQEISINKKKYTEDEATKKGIDTAIERLLSKIGKKNTVLEQKVLNSSKNNSTIELEVFVSVLESIGTTQYFEVGEEFDSR